MNVIQEAALLVPVAVIALINLSLYLAGERGTLLLPVRTDFPKTALDLLPLAQAPATSVAEPEFKEELRLAA